MAIDFAYSFAPPHRLTVARPNSGDKTLLDARPGSLRVAWTTDSVTRFPPMSFVTPAVNWEVILTPQLDGHAFPRSTWTRLDGCLPILDNRYLDGRGTLRLEIAGCETAAVARITLTNDGDRPHRFSLRCERPGGLSGYNPAWVETGAPADVLLAGWFDRADRVIVLGLGADRCAAPQSTVSQMGWDLQPGEARVAWLIRPYFALTADLDALRARDWQADFETARAEWRALLDRAARPAIPDPGARNGFYAGLADLFIMREPVGGGYIAGEPGTEAYRAPNSYEAGIMAVALDQCGLHDEAELGYRLSLDSQEPDGDWTEPKGWAHLMWGGSGFKCWAIMEHYRLTGDRDYLARVFPRMAANSRWQERQRARTRVMERGERPLTYGLMPRGMGDGGLKDGDDLYGVFIPHNIWATYADRCAVEAARILGRAEDAPELERIYEAALNDLLWSMENGAIVEDGYRWIPGVPGKTSGSRWAVLNALFPCGLLPADHELITGTLRKIESQLSPGGIPINTGWMADGMWVAITLDNLAEAHLARGEGDPAAEYLVAVLNHGTPVYSWCEERGQEPGTDKISGDRQHLWTPLAVARATRDCLIMESGDGSGMHLALGTPRAWLGSGQPVGISNAPTHFGRMSYELRYDAERRRVAGQVTFPDNDALRWANLHIRLPGRLRVASVEAGSGAAILPGGAGVRWENPRGTVRVDVALS